MICTKIHIDYSFDSTADLGTSFDSRVWYIEIGGANYTEYSVLVSQR